MLFKHVPISPLGQIVSMDLSAIKTYPATDVCFEGELFRSDNRMDFIFSAQ